MYSPALLYEITRQRQAEERARADSWRRRHPAPTGGSTAPAPRPKAGSRRHRFHLPTVLVHHGMP